MKLYAKTDNGEKRKVKDIYKCIDGKLVKLKKNTPAYFAAIEAGVKQGVIFFGT